VKRLLSLFLAIALVVPLTLARPAVASASTTIYDGDQSGWEAAVGDWLTEDFNDTTLNPEISVVSDYGEIVYGFWYDELYYSGGPTSFTTWTFSKPIYAFGGTWDLGSTWSDEFGRRVGGPGSNIEVLINGTWESVGVIDRDYEWEFWGFVSDVPFTQVRLQAYNDEGWVERHRLDDMVYSALPQYLTGGGQIVTDNPNTKKKDQAKVSFAGNLGYTGDFVLMGQYQFHLHNVNDTLAPGLDGAIFHSISVSQLVFGQDAGDGPAPPPAEANVAYYQIDGRLKMKGGKFVDGYTIYAYVADRGEPGVNDSINFALWDGGGVVYSSTWDFPHDSSVLGSTVTEFLSAGNLQIHAE